MKCENCEHLEYVDTDGLCMRGGCPVLVLDKCKATKNYGSCDLNNLKKELNIKYGTMAYQKEVSNEK